MQIYNITPVPEPRQSNKDKWNPKPSVQRYRAFKDLVRAAKLKLPVSCYHVIFILPMAQSWSNKKKLAMWGQPHQQVPDKDNLEKALLDAVYPDSDSHVWDGRVSKIWGYKGYIIVREDIDASGQDLPGWLRPILTQAEGYMVIPKELRRANDRTDEADTQEDK